METAIAKKSDSSASGARLNIKMSSYQYMIYDYKEKTVRSSFEAEWRIYASVN